MEITGLGINIKVKDIQKSRKFYESLGFIPIFAYGPKQFLDTLSANTPHAESSDATIGVHYALYGDKEKKFVIAELELVAKHIVLKHAEVVKEEIFSPKISAMVHVRSVVPLFSNPQVKINFPVRHYYWGSIEVALRDPDGFVVVFITPYSQEEFDTVSKFTTIEVIKPS